MDNTVWIGKCVVLTGNTAWIRTASNHATNGQRCKQTNTLRVPLHEKCNLKQTRDKRCQKQYLHRQQQAKTILNYPNFQQTEYTQVQVF
jgi:hypothetical protein